MQPQNTLTVRQLGLCDYSPVWKNMQAFSASRTAETGDELWLLQHPPVFTLGLNAKAEHVLDPSGIPLLKVDRGGQVTYHGPGQIVAYTLIDLQRRRIGIRELVSHLENSVIALLAEHGIHAAARRDAPGVYVDGAKIAALGLRVKRGCSYHGLSLNVDMDLAPFSRINPCGYADLPITQMRDLGIETSLPGIQSQLVRHMNDILGYNDVSFSEAAIIHE